MRGRVLTAALAAVLLLSGCGGAPAPVETPTPTPTPTPVPEQRPFVLPCSPAGGFHPILGTNRLNLTFAPLVYEGLFALDRQFRPEKKLCSGYTVSEDGLQWHFGLKEAYFSDGSPLTSVEAAASLDLARTSQRYGPRLADVARVDAGDGEVIVTLSRPNGGLPALLDIPIVKETGDPGRPLGTGPYVLTGEDLRQLSLTALEGAEVPAERIPLQAVGSGDDLVCAFDAREVSLVDTDLTGTDSPGYSARTETTDYPTTTLLYLGFNTKAGLCREDSLRLAVSQAVDRDNIAGKLMAGHAQAAALPLHPTAPGYDTELADTLSAGPDAALETLTAAGWAVGEDGKLRRGHTMLNLKLAVNLENTYKAAVADAIAADLTALGMTVQVVKLPWEEFNAALARRSFDLYLGETAMTADFDPEPLVGPEGALNLGGWADAALTPLLEARRAAAGPARPAEERALLERLGATVPIAPLCFKNGSLLTQWGQVTGAQPTQNNVFSQVEDWTILSD